MARSLWKRKVFVFSLPIAALVLLLAGLLAFSLPGKTEASGGITRYVGQTVGTDKSCASPGYTSVQAAVNAANPGDTVYLCGTTPYAEQVIITKKLTLTGTAGAAIEPPASFSTDTSNLPPQFATDNLLVPQAIVFIWGASANVTIKGITIEGPLPGNGGCAENEYGVLVIDGATATINDDQVLNIHDANSALYGCQFGVAIQVGRQYWPTAGYASVLVENFVGHATITGTTVVGYQKNGITIDAAGSTAKITHNIVNGAGRNNGNLFSPIIAQNGIQVGRGASAQVEYNTVAGNSYTGSGGASATGIVVFGGNCGETPTTALTTNVNVSKNTLTNNDIGVEFSNLITDSNNNCVLPPTPTNNIASHDSISNDAVSNVSGPNLFNYPGGYQAGISDEGYADKLTSNQVCGVGYTPLATPPPYLSQIDVVATNPIVTGNTTCSTSTNVVVASAPTNVSHNHHLRRVASFVK